eukprot:12530722-Alexandrium_andersonii.AAC.1
MSASLVGSEMCIRDSPAAARGGGALCGCPSRPRSRTGATPRCCGRPCPCLLYTSDAADDM